MDLPYALNIEIKKVIKDMIKETKVIREFCEIDKKNRQAFTEKERKEHIKHLYDSLDFFQHKFEYLSLRIRKEISKYDVEKNAEELEIFKKRLSKAVDSDPEVCKMILEQVKEGYIRFGEIDDFILQRIGGKDGLEELQPEQIQES